MIPILQLPQPWAWATITGHRAVHGVRHPVYIDWSNGEPERLPNHLKSPRAELRGVVAIVSSFNRRYLTQGTGWIRELGIDSPCVSDLTLGALLGFAEIVNCVRRDIVSQDPFADEEPWQLVFKNPLELANPVQRRAWNIADGFSIDAAVELLGRRRDALARSYVERIRAMEEAGLASAS